MRYKFRGKRLGDGEWIYGSLIESPEGVEIFFNWEFLEEAGNFICESVEVDPDTVGQWTGLHDRNGTEIYEGDVVDKTYQWVVVFRNGCFYGESRTIKNRDHLNTIKDDRERARISIEVIGTIHDKEEVVD